MEVETIMVNDNHKLVITKAWNETSWMFKVKKFQKLLGLFWSAGWKEDDRIMTDVKFFITLEEARGYANQIKQNFLR
jgi:hypothetical protein